MRIVVLDEYTVNPGDNPLDGPGLSAEWRIHKRTTANEILSRCEGAEIVLTNKVQLDATLLRRLTDLRLIVVTATGHDIVDSEAAAERGITVCNVPSYSAPSVAEHVFALLLALCRRVEAHDQEVHRGGRGPVADFCFWLTPQRELAGLTMGVVGWGEIGRRVGRIARAMEMRVVAHSRSQKVAEGELPPSWRTREELFAEADVISLHCPLTPQTRGMVGTELLACVKPTTFLINTARGALIDDQALAHALRVGTLAGAGIDTTTVEPIPLDHPLLSAPNCLMTPHLAWTTLAARKRLVETVRGNIAAFLAGAPRNVVAGPRHHD